MCVEYTPHKIWVIIEVKYLFLSVHNFCHSTVSKVLCSANKTAFRVYSLRKLIVSMNTNSRIGQCATVVSILSLFNSPLNEAACPPVSTVYSPIMPSEGIYTLIRLH